MNSSLYIVGLILTLIIAAIPSYFQVIKVGRGRNNRKVTKSGYVTIGLIVLTLVLQTWQYFYNLESEKVKEISYQKNLDRRDSIYNVRLNVSNNGITKTFSSELLKYSLKFDSSENRIVKVVNGKTSQNTIIDPEINIDNIILDSLKNDRYYFTIVTVSLEATAKNINIFMRVGELISSKYYRVSNFGYLYAKGGTIIKGGRSSYSFSYVDMAEIDHFAFEFQGFYENKDGKRIKVDRIEIYDVKRKTFGKLLTPHDVKAIQFFKDWK